MSKRPSPEAVEAGRKHIESLFVGGQSKRPETISEADKQAAITRRRIEELRDEIELSRELNCLEL